VVGREITRGALTMSASKSMQGRAAYGEADDALRVRVLGGLDGLRQLPPGGDENGSPPLPVYPSHAEVIIPASIGVMRRNREIAFRSLRERADTGLPEATCKDSRLEGSIRGSVFRVRAADRLRAALSIGHIQWMPIWVAHSSAARRAAHSAPHPSVVPFSLPSQSPMPVSQPRLLPGTSHVPSTSQI
jgi:hypothetical protein